MKTSSGIRRLRGFTLIELIVALVIIGFATFALFKMFRETMPRAPTPAQITQAAQCAQERMELILGRRWVLGYASIALDPSVATTCPANANLSVAVTGANALVAWTAVDNATTRYRLITVTVSIAPGYVLAGTQLAQLNALLASY